MLYAAVKLTEKSSGAYDWKYAKMILNKEFPNKVILMR